MTATMKSEKVPLRRDLSAKMLDNDVAEINGDAFCPKSNNEKRVYIMTYDSRQGSYYERGKLVICQVLIFQKGSGKEPALTLFEGDGTHCFAENTNHHNEKEQPSPLLKKYLRQSQSSATESETKKAKNNIFIAQSFWVLSGWWNEAKTDFYIGS